MMTATRAAGWYLLGLMEHLCICCVPTKEAAKEWSDETVEVWPVTPEELARTPDVECANCSRLLGDCPPRPAE